MIHTAKEGHLPSNSFGTKDRLAVDQDTYTIYRLDRVKTAHRLPYSLKVPLKDLLRSEDGHRVTRQQIQALADWQPQVARRRDIQFTPARAARARSS